MRRHALWHTGWTLAASAAALLLAPALLISQAATAPVPQGAGSTGQAAPPPPIIHREGILIVSGRGGPVRARRLEDLKMAEPVDNPGTPAKVALGRRLFFDTRLSADESVACVTCHRPDHGFADERTLAVGVFDRVGKRHSPSLINRGFGRTQFWDGRAATLEVQVVQPIEDPNEMNLPIGDAVKRLEADASYREAFQAVFDRPVSKDDLGRALAAYLRTIRSADSPYDRFTAGDTSALTAEQQRGLQVFRTKARCTFCHVEPLFSDELFQNTGVAWRAETGTYQDDGRFDVSGREPDRGKFKTPTLREIANTAPYMHDGSLATLEEVIDFYDGGGRSNRNLFPALRPLRLALEEKQALVKFLHSLSGTVTGK